MALLQTQRNIPETFGELSTTIVSQIISQATYFKAERVDFVSDRYPTVSIKNLDRERIHGDNCSNTGLPLIMIS